MAITSFPSIGRTDRIAPRQRTPGLISRWFKAWRAQRARRITVARLAALDDRTLLDIGLDRTEIESAVYDTRHERLRGYEELWWDPFSR